MKLLHHILTKYPFSSVIIIATWILCFMNIPESPLSNVKFIDKWTQSLMYLVIGLSISLEYLRATKHARPIFITVWGWLIPIIMGGVIEVLQTYCTGGRRSGEWLDFYADALGSTVALLIGILLVKYRARA